MMLNECCKLSSNLVFVDSEGEANLTLPVLLNVEECRLNNQADLVPMLPNTGVAFVVIKENKGNHSMKLLNSLVGTWPVLVLTLILSVIAGIIAWALVSKAIASSAFKLPFFLHVILAALSPQHSCLRLHYAKHPIRNTQSETHENALVLMYLSFI